jgi:photosystem II stability/assembly factor-like uncharacterized protein
MKTGAHRPRFHLCGQIIYNAARWMQYGVWWWRANAGKPPWQERIGMARGSEMLKKTTSLKLAASALLVPAWFAAHSVTAQVNPLVLPAKGPLTKQTMTRLLLSDAVRFGNRIVAVGDRGYIVYSDSNGENWERAETPPNLPLLTGVSFPDPKIGWAVGHDAVILKSTDEGKTWKQVYSAPKDQKPLMDILFVDDKNGFVVGAYGSFMETTDGGATWTARPLFEAPKVAPKPSAAKKGKDEFADDGGDAKSDDDKHLNAITKLADGKLLVVGESGTLAKSSDNGKSWSRIASPYKGSYFGVVQAKDGSVIVHGMRGRIYRSGPNLDNFVQIENKSVATLMGSTVFPDGAVVLAGLAGTLLISNDAGASFTAQPTGTTKAFSGVVLGGPNAAVLIGEDGARDILLAKAATPAAAATAAAPPAAPPAKDTAKK